MVLGSSSIYVLIVLSFYFLHYVFYFVLDALLEDLEAAIPPSITCGPKPTVGAGHNDLILEMQPEINGNLVQ